MRKMICLILSLLLTLCACGAREAEETASSPTRETVQYGQAAAQEPSAEASTEGSAGETLQPEAGVEVADVFADKAVMLDREETYYYHIPSIRISGVDTTEVNEQMYNELYSFIDQYVYQNPDYPYLGSMGYMWGVRDGIVSVVTQAVVGPEDATDPIYVIYHADISTGRQIGDEDMIASLGLRAEDYKAQVKAALERTFLELHQSDAGAAGYEQQFAKTLSDENVNNARPYIDESGELCVAAEVYSLSGDDSDCYLIALNGAVEPARPIAEPVA